MSDADMPKSPGWVSNILAIAGFIILIAIVVWGAFHFLNLATGGFSSFLSGSSAIQVTVNSKTVKSGDSLDITWKYSPVGSGTYAFLYQCKKGFEFKLPSGTNALQSIPCGSAYTIADNTRKTVRVIPLLTGSTTTDVPLSIIFMQSGTSTPSSRPQGSATVTVEPGSSASSAAQTNAKSETQNAQTPKPSTEQTIKKPQPEPSGPADLSVRIVSVGVVDPASGAYVPRQPMYQNDVVAVKFDIANVGHSATGSWYFTAELPTSPKTPYMSPPQTSLAPGAHIENTLKFDHVAPQGGMFSVAADPSNMVREASESNNSASEWISSGAAYYPSPTQYPGYYPYQY